MVFIKKEDFEMEINCRRMEGVLLRIVESQAAWSINVHIGAIVVASGAKYLA